jgi:hypothetical protein
MSNLGEVATEALNAERTGVVFLWAFEIYDEANTYHFYMVNNSEPVSVNGNTYSPVSFKVIPFGEGEEGKRRTRINIQNIDLLLVPMLREVTGKVYGVLSIVIPSDLNADPKQFTHEIKFIPMSVTDLVITATEVTLQLVFEKMSSKRFPYMLYNPFDFPGMF